MEQEKLNDLTSVKPNKKSVQNGSKEGNNTKFKDLYPSQREALEKLSDWYNSKELEATVEGYAGTGKTFILRYFIQHIVNWEIFTIVS